MNNLKITKFLKNPGKAYVRMTSKELKEFFSNGYTSILKGKCKNFYTISDLELGILVANHIATTDDHRFIVDLLMFALGKIEDLESSLTELEKLLNDKKKKEMEDNDDGI